MASLIGGGDVLYAVDAEGSVSRYDNAPTKWTKIGSPALGFAAGRGWLAGIFPAADPKAGGPSAKPSVGIYRAGQWFPISNPIVRRKSGTRVEKVEVVFASLVGGGDVLYGIDASGQPWRLNHATLGWGLIGGAVPGAYYAAGSGGRLARSDKSGVSLYYNARWTVVGTPMDAIAVVGARVFGFQSKSRGVFEAGPTPARISHATEFMRDYQHAVAMSPPARYRIAQTPQGHSLIFSTDADGLLSCTRELPNHPQGWVKSDLTPGLADAVSRAFPGKKFAVKTFDLAQPPSHPVTYLAAVVTVEGGDSLFSGQINASGWDGDNLRITWNYLAFDDASDPKPATPHSIVGIDLSASYHSGAAPSETGAPILVQVLRDRGNPNSGAAHYHVVTTGSGGRHWFSKPLQLDDAPYYRSVGGKLVPRVLSATGHQGDGTTRIYSLLLDGKTPTVFWGTARPAGKMYNGVSPLYQLPYRTPAIPTAMAPSARGLGSSGNSGCDLFVLADKSLFVLGYSDTLGDPKPLYTDDLLSGATCLRVARSRTTTFVCGINRQREVFSLQCPVGKEGSKTAWSSPVVVLTGAVDLDAMMLTASGTCVLFAHTEGAPDGPAMIQLTRDAVTGVWIQRHVLLPPSSQDDTYPSVSPGTRGVPVHGDGGITYATRVEATDEDGRPIPGLSLGITSTSPCSVYINHRYCLLDPKTPMYVPTDALGALNIVQEVDSLGAACYAILPSPEREISVAPEPPPPTSWGLSPARPDTSGVPVKRIAINPMSAILEPLKRVKSAADLRQPAKSASAPVSDAELASTAYWIAQCVPLIGQMPADGTWVTAAPATRSARKRVSKRVFGLDFTKGAVYFEGTPRSSRRGAGKWIKHHVHDALKHLKHLIHKVEQIVVQVVDKVVSFIITIAGDVFEVVARCYHDIVHFVDFVLRKIKLGMEGLLKWLGKTFSWDAILENQRVLVKVINLSITEVVSKLDGLKGSIDTAFDRITQPITDWAGIDALGDKVTPAVAVKLRDFTHKLPSAHWALKHLAAHARSAVSPYRPPDLSGKRDLQNALSALMSDFKNQVGVLDDTVQRLYEIARIVPSLSLPELARRVDGLVAGETLAAAKNSLELVIDVLELMADFIKDALNAPIHIPVLSKLYKLYVGSDLTMVGSIALVISVPLTAIAKTSGVNLWGTSAKSILGARDLDAIRRLIPAARARGAVSGGGVAAGARSNREGSPILRVDGWTFAWNCVGALASGAVLILTTTGAALAAPGVEVDAPAWKGNSELLAVANIFYAAPDLLNCLVHDLLPPDGDGGDEPSKHEGRLVIVERCSAILSGLGMFKSVADLGGLPEPVSAVSDLVLGCLGIAPTIAALAVDQSPQTGFSFASGLPASLGGMLAPVYLASVAGIVGGEFAAEVTAASVIGLFVSAVGWAGAEGTLMGVVTVQDLCALTSGGFRFGSSFVPGPDHDGNPKTLRKPAKAPRSRRPARRGVRGSKSRG